MSGADQNSSVADNLPRANECRLIQESSALAQEEALAAGEYLVWSPYEAHEAAAMLLRMLAPQEEPAPG